MPSGRAQGRRDVATNGTTTPAISQARAEISPLVERTFTAGLSDGWRRAQTLDPLTRELGILTLRHALGRVTFAVEYAAEISPWPAPGPGEISPTP